MSKVNDLMKFGIGVCGGRSGDVAYDNHEYKGQFESWSDLHYAISVL